MSACCVAPGLFFLACPRQLMEISYCRETSKEWMSENQLAHVPSTQGHTKASAILSTHQTEGANVLPQEGGSEILAPDLESFQGHLSKRK